MMKQILDFIRAAAPWVAMGLLLALYELLLDGSSVGMRERWNRLRGWEEK